MGEVGIGAKSGYKPRNAGSSQKLKKARRQTVPWSLLE